MVRIVFTVTARMNVVQAEHGIEMRGKIAVDEKFVVCVSNLKSETQYL